MSPIGRSVASGSRGGKLRDKKRRKPHPRPDAGAMVHRARTKRVDRVQEVNALHGDSGGTSRGKSPKRRETLEKGQRDGVAEVSQGGNGLDAVGLILAILIIAAFAFAGYADWSSAESYQSAWNEAYHVDEGVFYEVGKCEP